MNKRKKKTRIIALLLAMAGGLASPPAAVAQFYDFRGLFGWGNLDPEEIEEAETAGLMNRDLEEANGTIFNNGFGENNGGLFNNGFGENNGGLFNNGFGETTGGLTNQNFEEAPLGSGLLILLAASAGYTTLKNKRKNKKTNHQKKNAK